MNPIGALLIIVGVIMIIIGWRKKQDELLSAFTGHATTAGGSNISGSGEIGSPGLPLNGSGGSTGGALPA